MARSPGNLERALALGRQLLTDTEGRRRDEALNREAERRRLIRQDVAAENLRRDEKVALLRETQSLYRKV
jgi:hypothetical protein